MFESISHFGKPTSLYNDCDPLGFDLNQEQCYRARHVPKVRILSPSPLLHGNEPSQTPQTTPNLKQSPEASLPDRAILHALCLRAIPHLLRAEDTDLSKPFTELF